METITEKKSFELKSPAGEKVPPLCFPRRGKGAATPEPDGGIFMNDARAYLSKFQSGYGFGPPNTAGVYAIFVMNIALWRKCNIYSEHLLYIGSSNNISKRVYNEKHPYYKASIRFNNGNLDYGVIVKWMDVDDYLHIEKEMIKALKPPLNKMLYAAS